MGKCSVYEFVARDAAEIVKLGGGHDRHEERVKAKVFY